MDRGQIAYLQTKINERVYLMLCDPSSPIGEVREAMAEFVQEIDRVEQEAKDKEKPPEINVPTEVIDG